MKIILDLPSPLLSPNARTHWAQKRVATKAARTAAWVESLLGIDEILSNGGSLNFTGYSMAFFWPDARRRDDDNAEASCKAYRDGIADALGMDDHKLSKVAVSTFQVDRANPRLEITLHP